MLLSTSCICQLNAGTLERFGCLDFRKFRLSHGDFLPYEFFDSTDMLRWVTNMPRLAVLYLSPLDDLTIRTNEQKEPQEAFVAARQQDALEKAYAKCTFTTLCRLLSVIMRLRIQKGGAEHIRTSIWRRHESGASVITESKSIPENPAAENGSAKSSAGTNSPDSSKTP